jgi:TPR repeat protein
MRRGWVGIIIAAGCAHRAPDESLALPDAGGLVSACETGTASACRDLAVRTDAAPAVALGWEMKACTAGDPEACTAVADGVLRGDAREAPPALMPTLQAQCHTDAAACALVVRLRLHGGVIDADPAAAWAAADTGCNAGSEDACFAAAVMLVRGDAVDRDLARADALFEQACTGDVAWACADRDLVKEQLACDEGDDRACGEAGMAWYAGIGVWPDREYGYELLIRGCGAGDGDACRAIE